ncbi:chemotaxis response regulator CheY [Fundidesulfovibrio butyratiphilus]
MEYSKLRVLVVDDFSTMRKIVKNMLRKAGVKQVVEAENGKVALEMLERQAFNLVVLDWNMPGVSGLDVLKTIRADERLHCMPVLMVTSEALESQVLIAVQAGVTNYIVKPFTEEVLFKKINAIIKTHPDMETMCGDLP